MHLPTLVIVFWIPILAAAGSDGEEVPFAPEIPVSEDYVRRVWSIDYGLDGIWSSAQTPDGYLWLVTANGLVRFDGMRFVPVAAGNGRLPTDEVNQVFLAKSGDLWVGLPDGGVSRRSRGHFETVIPVGTSGSHDYTESIAEDSEGTIWIGQAINASASLWRNGRHSLLSKEAGLEAPRIQFQSSAHGKLWFANLKSGGFWNGERFQIVDPDGGEWGRLAHARSGGMWAVRGRKLLRYREGGAREDIADIGFLGGAVQISVIFEDLRGDLWLGTRAKGLFRFRPAGDAASAPSESATKDGSGRFARVQTSSPQISSMTEDRDGNLWVGTSGGLNRLRHRFLYLRQSGEGLHEDLTASICLDTEHRLWVAGGGKVFRATDDKARSFSLQEDLPPGVWVVCADSDRSVWIGGARGLAHWKDGIVRQTELKTAITGLLRDREGSLWAASIKGPLYRYRKGSLEPMPDSGGLTEPRALAEDSQGGIWAGTEGGLLFLKVPGGGFEQIPLPGLNQGEPVRFIVPDSTGSVWVGALHGGLYQVKHRRAKRLPPSAGFPVTDLRSLGLAPNGDFWIGTGKGLCRITRGELEAVFDGHKSTIDYSVYGPNDGMPVAGFAYGFTNSTTRSPNGHLWFATRRGLLEVRPEHLPPPSPQPVGVRIEEVVTSSSRHQIEDGRELSFPPRLPYLSIHYTMPDLLAPEQAVFQYRLSGFNLGNWLPMGNQRIATFTQLPPGRYHFEVAVVNETGAWMPNPATLDFVVHAAWWETWTFRAVAISAGIAALGGTIRSIERRRVRAKMRELEKERLLEQERSRIARDMHDELGSSLTRIAQMSDLAHSEANMSPLATMRLGEIAEVARSVCGTLDRIVWTVDPENDSLDSLVGYMAEFITEYLEVAQLDLELELPETVTGGKIDSKTRHQIMLVVKEALNNVVKHAGAGKVVCAVKCDHGKLEVSLCDNGKGFDLIEQSNSGRGLTNMKTRIAGLGGELQLRSTSGAGVSLAFAIPLAPPQNP